MLDGSGGESEKRGKPTVFDSINMEHVAETNLPKFQESFQHYYADGEEYVRQNPSKSALVAMGLGFLLAQLPLRWMFIALIKLLFLVVKPVTFIYAISKLVDDVRGARVPE